MLSMGRSIAAHAMRPFFVVGFLLLCSTWGGHAVHAQPAAGAAPHIEWEVKNRFRLFRNEADFQRHVAAAHGDGVLAAERRLASESDGRGWARDLVELLCVDRACRLLGSCDRDGERESYLAPRDHRVGVTLAGTLPANEGCAWSFDDGDGHPRQVSGPCNEEVKARLVSTRPTIASVDIILTDGTALRLVSEIVVRDALIAGMGDSIAAGEGNPDRAVRLSDQGFCLKRFGDIIGRDAPASAATNPAPRWRTRTRGPPTGRCKARAGSAVPATVRSTAIRCAPRSRSPSRTRISPSRFFRSAARAQPSMPDSSTTSGRASARARARVLPVRGRFAPRSAR